MVRKQVTNKTSSTHVIQTQTSPREQEEENTKVVKLGKEREPDSDIVIHESLAEYANATPQLHIMQEDLAHLKLRCEKQPERQQAP